MSDDSDDAVAVDEWLGDAVAHRADINERLRVQALAMAIDVARETDCGEKEIVAIASSFLAFLKGETTSA